jgi:hypothetical protein
MTAELLHRPRWQTAGMRRLLRVLAVFAAAVAVLAAGALALALQGAPRVPQRADIAPADIERALAFARAHDPRRLPPGLLRIAFVNERDADLLLHHAAQRWLAATTRLKVEPGRAQVEASVPLAGGRWLNVELQLRQAERFPVVERLHVGRLPVPPSWVLPLAQRFAAWRGLSAEALAVGDFVRGVRFGPGHAIVSYRYSADARERVLAAVLPPEQRQRVQAYAAKLAQLADPPPADGSISLARLLPPLFRLAAERSAAGADAAEENRAAIVALVLYSNRRALDLIMPAAQDGIPVRPLVVLLQRRDDLPRHFLVSAALAAEAGSPLADAVGLWKELDDARRGSGFSFDDLAADRAGTRFGELAVAEPARLQRRVAAVQEEEEFAPAVDGLPSFMHEAEFVRRFGGIGAPAYRRMMAEVERRVAALPLWR